VIAVWTFENETRARPNRSLQSREASIVWLKAIVRWLGSWGVSVSFPQEWHDAHRPELGWMSQQWLAEHRAGGR